jgi:hypothetical protein
VELCGVELSENLANRDSLVVVDVDVPDNPGQLAADLDLVRRRKIAGRNYGDAQLAPSYRLRDVLNGVGLYVPLPGEDSRYDYPNHDDGRQQPAREAPDASVRLANAESVRDSIWGDGRRAHQPASHAAPSARRRK